MLPRSRPGPTPILCGRSPHRRTAAATAHEPVAACSRFQLPTVSGLDRRATGSARDVGPGWCGLTAFPTQDGGVNAKSLVTNWRPPMPVVLVLLTLRLGRTQHAG